MAKVVIDDLYKIYKGDKGKDVLAVEGVNLVVEDKEFVVLVGPSGCGKTTTLRMVAGLEEISKGSIYIGDKRVNDTPPKDRDIAMVFQNYALYPHMTVYKNMAFGLQLRNFPQAEIERRVRDAAQILGLSDEMLLRRPKALSGGQRQRVAVGRAIVRQPSAFLFDEPLSNLDAKMRVQMRTEISKLHDRLSSTMIYVTHDQVEAMTMGDRIVVMKNGRVQQVAEPMEIYNNPCNMFVAGFIGSPAMNFFEGTIQAEGSSLFFVESAVADSGAAGIKLRLWDEQARKMAPFQNKNVVFGIRPEDLHPTQGHGKGDPQAVLHARIDVLEAMGAETHLYLKAGAQTLIARFQGVCAGMIDQKLEIGVDMKKGTFFKSVPKTDFGRNGSGDIDVETWQTACERIA